MSSLNVRYQVLHPYRTTGKIIVYIVQSDDLMMAFHCLRYKNLFELLCAWLFHLAFNVCKYLQRAFSARPPRVRRLTKARNLIPFVKRKLIIYAGSSEFVIRILEYRRVRLAGNEKEWETIYSM
jgi:hypothetical protein